MLVAMASADGDQPSKRRRTSPSDTLVSIANRMKCPISGELFVDPVFTADGQIYERESIQQWLSEHGTSPATGCSLTTKNVVSVALARSVVSDIVDAEDVLPASERSGWMVRRGMCAMAGKDQQLAKQYFDKAMQLGSADAKYHMGRLLLAEAAAEGVPEACGLKLGSSAATLKAQGRSAEEAKAAGCDGKEIYELCAKFGNEYGGEAGIPCVTVYGEFGKLYARDNDNCPPWIVLGVQYPSSELKKRVRPLRWA